MRNWKLLFVDDNALYRTGVAHRLRLDNCDVEMADNPVDGRRMLESGEYDLAILDMQLYDTDPLDFSGIELAIESAPGIPKILVTLHDQNYLDQTFETLRRRGVDPARLPRVVHKLGEQRVNDGDGVWELRRAVRRALPPPVFIVHGWDRQTRAAVREFVGDLGLVPRILDEGPIGDFVLARLEEEAQLAHFAIVLLTADDRGCRRDESGNQRPRARQNVIFELGFFLAALGRKRVLALYEAGVELPSDYGGVTYVELDSAGAWKTQVERQLRNAGIDLDFYRPESPAAGAASVGAQSSG